MRLMGLPILPLRLGMVQVQDLQDTSDDDSRPPRDYQDAAAPPSQPFTTIQPLQPSQPGLAVDTDTGSIAQTMAPPPPIMVNPWSGGGLIMDQPTAPVETAQVTSPAAPNPPAIIVDPWHGQDVDTQVYTDQPATPATAAAAAWDDSTPVVVPTDAGAPQLTLTPGQTTTTGIIPPSYQTPAPVTQPSSSMEPWLIAAAALFGIYLLTRKR